MVTVICTRRLTLAIGLCILTLMRGNVSIDLEAQPVTETLPDVLTDAEWTAFVGEFNMKAPTGLRNLAVFTLMREAGLRTCEVIGLKVSDVRDDELDGRRVTALRLETTKGGKERVVYLSAAADGLLRRWLERRAALGLGKFKHVFTTLQGGALKDAYLRELCARKGSEAGIVWRLHPHALRHTCATNLLEKTGDLALVQDVLGHARAETTRVYAKVRNTRLARAMVGEPEAEAADEAGAGVADLAEALAGLTVEQRKALAAALLAGTE